MGLFLNRKYFQDAITELASKQKKAEIDPSDLLTMEIAYTKFFHLTEEELEQVINEYKKTYNDDVIHSYAKLIAVMEYVNLKHHY